ncbi:MAG: hypothetical protein M1338_05635, partial [Patescibacteria group bacterium]|nr:hypothetical protein [Patescibacteria group bacterium]
TVIWNMYPLEKNLQFLENAGFKVEKIIETKIDQELAGLMDPEDYQANKGCRFCVIVKARKG